MKRLIYSITFLLIVASMVSCRKNLDHQSKQIVIDTTIASGVEYVLDLKSYGDADDVATITKQGTAYTKSEITNTAGAFAPVYHYVATSKTSTTDQVVLSITEANGNRRHSADSTNITINFVIK